MSWATAPLESKDQESASVGRRLKSFHAQNMQHLYILLMRDMHFECAFRGC
jgi:hypothetical protein